MKSKNNEVRSSARTIFVALGLVIGSIMVTGCDQVMGDLLKHDVAQTEDDTPKRNAFSDAFKQLKAKCPHKVNDYLTLEKVRLKDVDHVEFRYQVADAGVKAVSDATRRPMRQLTMVRLLDEPISESIIDLDLGTNHSFKDSSGTQLLSFNVSKLDLLRAQKKIDKGEDTTAKAKELLETALSIPDPPKAAADVDQVMPVQLPAATAPTPVAESTESSESSASSDVAGLLEVLRAAKEKHAIPTNEAPGGQGSPWHVEKIEPNSARTVNNPAGVRSNPFAK